jgi:anti-sigma factor RsiW
MTTCSRYEKSLALYVEADLPARDIAALERHLEACPGCQALLRELEGSQRALKALAAEPLPEGALAAVRARVLAEARRNRTEGPPVPAWTWASIAAVIACLALAGGLAWREKAASRRPVVAGLSSPTPAQAPVPPATPGIVAPPPGQALAAAGDAAASPRSQNGRASGRAARSGARPALPAPTDTPPASTPRRPRAVYGSEGSGTTASPKAAPESALTPEEADQLARAVVALARIEGLSDAVEGSTEETGLATGEDEEDTPDSVAASGTLVRWTTADPDVVIYWQLDSNGGDS